METRQDPASKVYEPPALVVLGEASELTLGPAGIGHHGDAIFPLHGSAS